MASEESPPERPKTPCPVLKEHQLELHYDITIPETIIHCRQQNYHLLASTKNMVHYAVLPVNFTGQYIFRLSQTIPQDAYVDLFARCEQVSLLLEGTLRWKFVKGELISSQLRTGDNHLKIVFDTTKDPRHKFSKALHIKSFTKKS